MKALLRKSLAPACIRGNMPLPHPDASVRHEREQGIYIYKRRSATATTRDSHTTGHRLNSASASTATAATASGKNDFTATCRSLICASATTTQPPSSKIEGPIMTLC